MFHGFGVRGAVEPRRLARPRQVHGNAVAHAGAGGRLEPMEADAVVSTQPALAVGVVTADCVPILVSSLDGSAVAAIHAGWRGLAAGVVPTAITALRGRLASGVRLVGAIGPHIGSCCYEVDEPVLDPLRSRFGTQLETQMWPTRPGHARLDLAGLVRFALYEAGLDHTEQGDLGAVCTQCDSDRFHSYRRDGRNAGRLVNFVAARGESNSSPDLEL
ncbi:MAG: polyphenol oxidase family protein [Myxococcota bacterium]